MPKILIYLPVVSVKEDVKFIEFRKMPEGRLSGFLPISNLPLPSEVGENSEEGTASAWQEILNHLYLFHFYVNYHRSDKKLVIARLSRKRISPVRGRRLAEFYLDDKESVEVLVKLLSDLSSGSVKIFNPKPKIVTFKLPYKYSVK